MPNMFQCKKGMCLREIATPADEYCPKHLPAPIDPLESEDWLDILLNQFSNWCHGQGIQITPEGFKQAITHRIEEEVRKAEQRGYMRGLAQNKLDLLDTPKEGEL